MHKEELIKFWKSSAFGSEFSNFLKDFSSLRDKAFFHNSAHMQCLCLITCQAFLLTWCLFGNQKNESLRAGDRFTGEFWLTDIYLFNDNTGHGLDASDKCWWIEKTFLRHTGTRLVHLKINYTHSCTHYHHHRRHHYYNVHLRCLVIHREVIGTMLRRCIISPLVKNKVYKIRL